MEAAIYNICQPSSGITLYFGLIQVSSVVVCRNTSW